MCIIIKEMSLHWIIGLLALWSGVIKAGNVTGTPGVGTTTSNEISAFIISIKITNHVYNDSLEDHQSQSYKILRQDVENVFFEMYMFTPSAQYQEITEMTFSNGSVIANSTVLFRTKQKSGQTVKDIFVANYQQHPSLKLDLNITYTADQEPVPVPLSLPQDIPNFISSATLQPISSSNSHTITNLLDPIQSEHSMISTISIPDSSDPDRSLNNSDATTATHSVTYITNSSLQSTLNSTTTNDIATVHTFSVTPTVPASHTTTMRVHTDSINSSMSPLNPLKTTVQVNRTTSNIFGSSPLTITEHLDTNISNMPTNKSASSSSTTTVHASSNISTKSASSSSTTTVHASSNISTKSASSSSTTTVHASSNISAMSASSSPVNPGKTVTQESKGPDGSGTGATEQGVPSWGIAILALAAIILFFMLVLLILLLLFWCCWWRQRGFMSVSVPDPTGYYNPDIPMFSTHSTYESHNGKSLAKLAALTKQPLVPPSSHLHRALFVPSQL